MIENIINFLEIFSYPFVIRALIGGVLISILCGISGQIILSKKMANLSDGLSHISLLGILIGVINSFNLNIVTLLSSVFSGLTVEFIRSKKLMSSDTAIVFLSVISLALFSLINQVWKVRRNLESLLFGSVNLISLEKLIFILLASILLLSLFLYCYRQIIGVMLNDEKAKFSGISYQLYNYLIVVFVSSTIAISIEIIGTLLVGGVLIIPALTAQLLKKGVKMSFIFSILFAIIGMVLGIFGSAILNLPTGGTVILSYLFIYLIVALLN
jgi:zinc transport system permease protein